MFASVAAFEFRYQVKSPLFLAVAALCFLAAFADMAIFKVVQIGGGNVLFNSPHVIIVTHLIMSLLFLFLGAAIVSDVIVRDDQSGFGPLIRSTRLTKVDYLFGRFTGAFAVGALIMALVTLGAWLGTLIPLGNEDMIGPNRLSGYVYGLGFFALPNALIISAILFALATITRSTAGTFIGVIGLLVLYLVGQRVMETQSGLLDLRVFADPFAMSTYMTGSRYFTAAELNAGLVPVTDAMIHSRILWVGIALGLLGLTYARFSFAERKLSRRRQRKLARQAPIEAALHAPAPTGHFARLAEPRFTRATAVAQVLARAKLEARFIFKSPVFLILLLIASLFTLPGLFFATGFLDGPLYPLTTIVIPIVEASFTTLLIVIGAYYGGELVWRDRERKINEIVDSTPLPDWAQMLPKLLGLALVLFATLLVAAGMAILVQAINGAVDIRLGDYMRWYLLPGAVEAVLIAALAVFVAALSPSKYAAWGILTIFLIVRLFGAAFGLEHPIMLYSSTPPVPLSDLNGTGSGFGAWWFRLFWAATALLMLIVVQLLWPRGTTPPLRTRLAHLPSKLAGQGGLVAVAALALVAASGGWILYNTLVLNSFRTSAATERHFAELEKRYFHFARLPQPVVRHLALDVALYPEALRADVRGRYRLVNENDAPIDQVHLRLLSLDLKLLKVDFPGSRLALDDRRFGYRIYRLDTPMQPGEERELAFVTRREQRGFRAAGNESRIASNGTDLSTFEITPRIGMSDIGLIEDPVRRRKLRLPERQPLPALDDMRATMLTPSGDAGWTTTDITVSTSADQLPVAPGKRVAERIAGGRRSVRFVSDTPIKNQLSIQSARFAVERVMHRGVEHAVYYHPEHRWNVDRMLTASRASLDYYTRAFGPYPFGHIRMVERPGPGGGQAFPGSVAVNEGIFAMDVRNPDSLDYVTMLIAHEIAHQYWGQQVLGARMHGGSMLYETLSQYSALMVLKRLRGERSLQPFTQFQLDRYLAGRRTQTAAERPLASAGIDQDYVNYGKGALALYLLQERIGEDKVNRALRKYLDRYRFTVAPYPRSLDFIALLRAEASGAEEQQLITDLLERITIYDLKVGEPGAVRRADGRWDVTVSVEAGKYYYDGKGAETEARLAERIEVGLFASAPGLSTFKPADVLMMRRVPIRSGQQVLRFVTAQKPLYAGVDPFNLYIDRSARDNVAPVP